MTGIPNPLDQAPPATRAELAKLPAGLTVGSVVSMPHGWGVTLLDEHGDIAAQGDVGRSGDVVRVDYRFAA